MHKRIYVRGRGRAFRNSFLERLSKSPPTMTIAFYWLLMICFVLCSIKYTRLTVYESGEVLLCGVFTWSFMEYILHRFLFHIDDFFSSLKRFHYIVHGIHHEHPGDSERLFMPPLPAGIAALLLFLFSYAFIGYNAFSFMTGLSAGYLMYSYIHYTIHSQPANPLFYKPWAHHAKHHFKYPDKAFGVSSPLWDIIFRTMPPKKNK